jgi:hypothetical protein
MHQARSAGYFQSDATRARRFVLLRRKIFPTIVPLVGLVAAFANVYRWLVKAAPQTGKKTVSANTYVKYKYLWGAQKSALVT